MSLYEIVSMVRALEKQGQKAKPQVSDEDWEQAEQLLAAATVNDPSVRV
ncbi:hypothetical protein H7H48_02205 [Nitratireductor sp. B36]|nr:hypothetical protein [Nitratireductor sp. B36]MCC5777849.1 hypothetical protein [Nitratireductor sp. B36]